MAEVLVVEDDFSTRRNVVHLLEKSGYDVLAAESGEEAVSLVKSVTPDLIVSDIMMPGMDGYELFRRVNGEDKADHIPFIFLTAKTEVTDFREGMLAGADDYIAKPFKARDLLKSIETRLKKKEKFENKFHQFKNEITHNINHDFRTPLVPIMGYTQMIIDNYWHLGPAEVLDMMEKIKSSGSGMLKQIEKFLVLSELEDVRDHQSENFTSVMEVVYNCSSRIASVSGRGDDLLLHLNNAYVNIPASKLERMIFELLENACRFSNSGSPIEITSLAEKGTYTITITDYGKGMTVDQVKNNFQRPGFGLGLAIVKKIARIYNIDLSVESQSGMYTKVILKFHLK